MAPPPPRHPQPPPGPPPHPPERLPSDRASRAAGPATAGEGPPAERRADPAPQPSADACANCSTRAVDRFCPRCGQDQRLGRLTLRGIAGPLLDALFSLDSRLARTFAALARRPASVAIDYVEGRRARHVHPLRLYVAAIALTALVAALTGRPYIDAANSMIEIRTSEGDALELNDELVGYTLLLALPLFALFLRVLFPRSGRNWAECTVLALYLSGFTQLVNLALLALTPLAPFALERLRGLTVVVWTAWGAIGFFGAPRISGSLRAVLALMLYLLTVVGCLLGLTVALGRFG